MPRIGHPRQNLLEDAIDECKRITLAKYDEGVRIIRNAARTQGIDKTLAAHDLDFILGPMDGRMPTIAAAAGYPVGTMPLGYSKTNGRPFGMCIVAAAENEDKILRAMTAWDATIAKRKAPPQMQSTASNLRRKWQTLVPRVWSELGSAVISCVALLGCKAHGSNWPGGSSQEKAVFLKQDSTIYTTSSGE